jgi:hypothetical protein
MCVRCEPAAHAAAARVLNAARMERACPLHVRCGCLGGRGAGLVTATTRALRGSEIPSPPSAQSETDDGTFQDLRGLHSYRVLETKQKCAALVTASLPPESRKCAKVCCPAPAKSKVYEKVYSVVSAMTRTSLISNRIVVMSLVAFIWEWCDASVRGVSALGPGLSYRTERKSLERVPCEARSPAQMWNLSNYSMQGRCCILPNREHQALAS